MVSWHNVELDTINKKAVPCLNFTLPSRWDKIDVIYVFRDTTAPIVLYRGSEFNAPNRQAFKVNFLFENIFMICSNLTCGARSGRLWLVSSSVRMEARSMYLDDVPILDKPEEV